MGTMLGQGRASPNEEEYRQEQHWESAEEVGELVIIVANTDYNLGNVVPTNRQRRIREISVRTTTTVNTVVRLMVGTSVRLSFDVTAESTRVWSSQDGRRINEAEQPVIQVTDVTGGTVYVTASGLQDFSV